MPLPPTRQPRPRSARPGSGTRVGRGTGGHVQRARKNTPSSSVEAALRNVLPGLVQEIVQQLQRPGPHIESRVFDQPVPQPVTAQPRTLPRSEAQRKEMQRVPSQFECYESPQPSRDGPRRGPIERPRSYEVPGSRTPIRDFIQSVEGGPDGPDLLDQTDDLPTIERIFEQQHDLLANRDSIQQQQDRRRTQECIIVDLEDDDLYTSL